MGKVARDETLKRVADAVEAIALNGAGSASDVQNWKAVQNLVRAGMGPKAFPVGTQFVVEKETSLSAALGAHTGITACSVNEETFLAAEGIVGSGVHEFRFNGSAWIYGEQAVSLTTYGLSVTGTPAEGDEVVVTEAYDKIVFEVAGFKTVNGSPRMVLAMRDVIYGRQFDQKEALYYATEALPAGSYYFTVKNDAWKASENDKAFYFTLSNAIPAGGQIRAGFAHDATLNGKSISTYASGSDTAALETVAISETPIGGATNLGDTDGTAAVNFFHRLVLGSNNYKESALRQWINSDKAANAWWASSNKFDVKPDYANVAGLLHGMDADFLEVIQETVVACKTNNTFELPGWTLNTAYTVKDRFYLLSRNEVGFGTENIAEGSVLDLYDGAQNVDRVKYDIAAQSTARTWWLRSPYPGYASIVRRVGSDGSLYNNLASDGLGAVAACEIG